MLFLLLLVGCVAKPLLGPDLARSATEARAIELATLRNLLILGQRYKDSTAGGIRSLCVSAGSLA